MKSYFNYHSNFLVRIFLVLILLSTGLLVLITPCVAQNQWTQKAKVLQALHTVEVYNPLTDTWEKAPDMLNGRCRVSASVVNKKIYVFGGYTGTWPGQMCVKVEEYDPSKD